MTVSSPNLVPPPAVEARIGPSDRFRAYAMRALQLGWGQAPSCKICAGRTKRFDVVDLAKVCASSTYRDGLIGMPIYYSRCDDCGFIFTSFFDEFDAELWREVIYNPEYYDRIDVEYESVRPVENASFMQMLLSRRRASVVGLDYGGGNGSTCQRMRAAGYDYDSYDPFGGVDVLPANAGRYNVCSAFEVFEHAADPCSVLADIVQRCSPGRLMILVSTSLHDDQVSGEGRLGWAYAAPRNGHISLFSRRSMQVMADKFSLDYVACGAGSHLLLRQEPEYAAWRALLRAKLVTRLRRSLR